MIRIMHRNADGTLDASLDEGSLPEALADPTALTWVDFLDEPPEACTRVLAGIFHFHPLAIDDALHQSHVPKVDDWGSYLYLVLHAIHFDVKAAQMLRTMELDVFAGPNYVVTHREDTLEAVDKVWMLCGKDERVMGRGAARLLYHMIDEIVAGHLPAVDAMDEEMDRIEESILASPNSGSLTEVLGIKRALLHLRRIVAPQRETLNRLARDEFAAVPRGERVYFRDVYDHLVRLYDIVEGLRDLAAGALDTYLSVINNRMNEVMKTFTLITTLFMPISFLTGFFGMNFFTASAPPPAWTGRVAFIVICAAMILVPSLMYLWLRRRRWV
jgi:magnesium transporter